MQTGIKTVPEATKRMTKPRRPKLKVDTSAAAATEDTGEAAVTEFGRAFHEIEDRQCVYDVEDG
jgi:hypothetical protein